MKEKRWTLKRKDVYHEVLYERRGDPFSILVDGIPLSFTTTPAQAWLGYEIPFTCADKNCCLIKKGGRVELAVGGKWRGKRFVPHAEAPKWWYVFPLLCLLLPFITAGGVLSILVGILGACLCVKFCRMHIPVAARFILCLLTTAACWVLCSYALVLLTRICGFLPPWRYSLRL